MCCFFFFKQKTAYEMRISDWSSDVCSSDLRADVAPVVDQEAAIDQSSVVVFLREGKRAEMDPDAIFRRCGAHGREDRVGRLIPEVPRRPLAVAIEQAAHLRREQHDRAARSDANTSELQSLMRISYAVFCLKKKKK